jgi:hypothetical protein
MKIENFVLTLMNSGKILIVTSSLHRIEKFLEEEWLEGEPENFKKFKETKEKLDVDVVRAIELVGFTYDISVQRFDDEMEINNVTLEEMLKFYEDNEELYMNKARENTDYDSQGRIILPYDDESDEID